MNVLGFDTATAGSSACLLREDGEAFEVRPPAERVLARPGHARELMPAIAGVLEKAAVGFESVEAIAVGRGPGSFTGLRIGLATARALAQARGIPVHPVSSLSALAAGIDAEHRLALIDARRDELFAVVYGGDAATPLAGPVAASVERVIELVAEAGVAPLAAGDGSVRFADALKSAGIAVEPGGSPVHAISALHVCRLAAGVGPLPPEAVVPDYLREPDARPSK